MTVCVQVVLQVVMGNNVCGLMGVTDNVTVNVIVVVPVLVNVKLGL